MSDINPLTPLWQLSVAEFLELQRQQFYSLSAKKYEYGLKGLAKILGCSRTKAYEIKKTGMLDEAIFQSGKTIIVDREKVLEIIAQNNIKNKQ